MSGRSSASAANQEPPASKPQQPSAKPDANNAAAGKPSKPAGGTASGGKAEKGGQADAGRRKKDRYHTDPVPAGKPKPVEWQDAEVDKKKVLTATLSVSCKTILDNLDQFDADKLEVLPEDGVIYRADDDQRQAVERQIAATAAFQQRTIADPVVGTLGGEWTVFGLARSGLQVPAAYYAKYSANLEKTLKEKAGVLHNAKYTEYDRVVLALASLGRDVDKVAGYDMLEPLADFATLTKRILPCEGRRNRQRRGCAGTSRSDGDGSGLVRARRVRPVSERANPAL